MIEEASDSNEYIPTIPAELEPGNQRELLHQLKEYQGTTDPALTERLADFISAVDRPSISDKAVAGPKAQYLSTPKKGAKVQALLQPWVDALDRAQLSAVEIALAQAQLYELAGLNIEAREQLESIFLYIDNRSPELRTETERAIGNLAADMEDRLLER